MENFSGQTLIPLKAFRNGCSSSIYQISEIDCAKVNHYLSSEEIINDEFSLRRLERECNIMEIFYSNGISVPKPRGMFNVEINYKKIPALVMEFIKVQETGEIGYEIHKRFTERKRIELEKARELGYIPGVDAGDEPNVLWDPERNNIVLIDFEDWRLLKSNF